MDLARTLLPDRVFTREEAAAFLSRTPDTIKKYAEEGRLPEHRLGRSPTYILSEIIAAVAANLLASDTPMPDPPAKYTPKHRSPQ